jgi:hypothetical protein
LSSRRLTEYLGKFFGLPYRDHLDQSIDTALAASIAATTHGRFELDRAIDEYMRAYIEPTSLLKALAAAAKRVPLIFIVNSFDRQIEEAMKQRGCPYQVMITDDRGRWMVRPAIHDEYLPLDARSEKGLRFDEVSTIVWIRQNGPELEGRVRYRVTEEDLLEAVALEAVGVNWPLHVAVQAWRENRSLVCLGLGLSEWWDRWFLRKVARQAFTERSRGWYFSPVTDAVTQEWLSFLGLRCYSVDLGDFGTTLQSVIDRTGLSTR